MVVVFAIWLGSERVPGRVIDRRFGIFRTDADPTIEVGVWANGDYAVARGNVILRVEEGRRTEPLTYGRMGILADVVFEEYGVPV